MEMMQAQRYVFRFTSVVVAPTKLRLCGSWLTYRSKVCAYMCVYVCVCVAYASLWAVARMHLPFDVERSTEPPS